VFPGALRGPFVGYKHRCPVVAFFLADARICLHTRF
jgi:hypothetical protein